MGLYSMGPFLGQNIPTNLDASIAAHESDDGALLNLPEELKIDFGK
jgi:hypothetical protein